MNFGSIVKKHRIKKHLTQTSVAQLIGFTREAISNIETGQAQPKLSTLFQLSDLLGFSFQEVQDLYIRERSSKKRQTARPLP